MSRAFSAAAVVVLTLVALGAAVATGCPRLVTTGLAIALGCAVSAFGTSVAFSALESRSAARRARRHAMRAARAVRQPIVLRPIQAPVPRLAAPAHQSLRLAA